MPVVILVALEITAKCAQLVLDKKLGPDDRIARGSYDWATRMLKRLGFRDLKQVETAIEPYDDDHVSTVAAGTRQGQMTRIRVDAISRAG